MLDIKLDTAREELRAHATPRSRSECQRQWRRDYTIFNDSSQLDVDFCPHSIAFANATTFCMSKKTTTQQKSLRPSTSRAASGDTER